MRNPVKALLLVVHCVLVQSLREKKILPANWVSQTSKKNSAKKTDRQHKI
jgi:hypothetical protein